MFSIERPQVIVTLPASRHLLSAYSVLVTIASLIVLCKDNKNSNNNLKHLLKVKDRKEEGEGGEEGGGGKKEGRRTGGGRFSFLPVS